MGAITIPEDKQAAQQLVKTELSHVTEAVGLIRQELEGKVPLIGFSAAPWTLFYYMVGGSSKKQQGEGERWLKEHPEESHRLLDSLCTIVIEYMSAQATLPLPTYPHVEAGAQLLQLFEAMGMFISEASFEEHALPHLLRIARELKARHPEVPLMVFPRGAAYSLPSLREAFDVLTLDGSIPRSSVRSLLPEVCLQGDFDPSLLVDGTEESVRQAVNQMLDELGADQLIANLREGFVQTSPPLHAVIKVEGISRLHAMPCFRVRDKRLAPFSGLGGKEDPALVSVFVDAVHNYKPK
ncbi:MAG: hypothetical protein SGPRY_014237 [Prymnesium sp.]